MTDQQFKEFVLQQLDTEKTDLKDVNLSEQQSEQQNDAENVPVLNTSP
jgi:hypothetical protein